LKEPVGFAAAPVGDRAAQPAFHAAQAGAQILLLAGERRFQDALENLLVAKLQSLLDRRIRIKRGEAGVVIALEKSRKDARYTSRANSPGMPASVVTVKS